MELIFEEGKYSDKELFERKKLSETAEKINAFLREKEPEFWDARIRGDFEEVFRCLCRDMQITVDDQRFVYFLDFNFRCNTRIVNITPDYGIFLESGLAALKYGEQDGDCSSEFCKRHDSVLDSMAVLAERVIQELEIKKPGHYETKKTWFANMRQNKAATLEEALQRILFLNQMLWQTGSILVGLGRMDSLLYPYYQRDCSAGILTREKAASMLRDFMVRLHEHYWFKSSELLGDTGQVIVLGGCDQNGSYVRNELTDMILNLVRELQLSDPKVVLRVNKNIPQDLLEDAVRCMMTGVGSPLLSNDDVVIPKLTAFGVDEADAYCYTTSACWEPLIGGKSSSMNNERSLSFIKALDNLLMEEKLSRFASFEDFKQCFCRYLKREILLVERGLYEQKYERNTLYSVFLQGCRESRKDIVDGGAKYHNVGMTTLALGNAVNALLNIRKYVFEEKRYSLADVKKMRLYNYEGYPEAVEMLKSNPEQYGCDSEDVIALSNEMLRFVSEYTKDFRTPIGGRLKFGASSPSFIMEGCKTQASFDGRKEGEPFRVHISNENLSSYTELIRFAADLDYGENRFNGNVVDFMVSPAFIRQNFDKFVLVLRRGMEAGFFQLQMNVIDSKTLKEAKENPDKFPHLIVRVWGFSAYFVELPESYQDLLIRRAEQNEGKK